MPKRKKIFMIAPRLPFPALSGGEKWVFTLAKLLAADHDIFLFGFLNPGIEKQQTALAMALEARVFKKVFFLPKPEPGANPSMPALPALYYSAEAADHLRERIRETVPDLVHVIFSEMAAYQAVIPEGVPAVYTEIDSSYLFPWKYYLRETAGLKGYFKFGEMLKGRKYLNRHAARFSAATAISEGDARHIARFFKGKEILYTPNAVLPEELRSPTPPARRNSEMLFVGHYPHFPNEDAALRLAVNIFPAVKRALPDASLTLAGSCPTPAIAALAGNGVEVTGAVSDMKPYLERAGVFAAPTRYGFGTKGKVLEAFAAGIPVVASKNVFNGIKGLQDGRQLLVADSDRDFSGKILLLLRDPALRAKLAAEGLAFVTGNFNFRNVAGEVAALYGRLCPPR